MNPLDANHDRRSAPLGGREYPAGAAGTHLANGLLLSGDDAPAFERAGYNVCPCYVRCSARIVAGDDSAPSGQVLAAIDCNGRRWQDVADLADLADARPAEGVFDGQTQRAVVGWLDGRYVAETHANLERELSGFGCFAVLTII